MQAFLNWLSSFLASYGPWILASLVPTLITGLSVSPKTAGAASWVQKAAGILKQLMNLLSFVTHKDAPGTFQLPLKLGKVIKKGPKGPGAAGCAAMILIALLSQTGCAALWSDTKGAGKTVFDCAKSVAKDNAVRLLPAIVAILSGGADNWRDQLEAFGKQFGSEALACVIAAAQDHFQEKSADASGSAATESAMGLTRSRTFMAEKNWSTSLVVQ